MQSCCNSSSPSITSTTATTLFSFHWILLHLFLNLESAQGLGKAITYHLLRGYAQLKVKGISVQ